MKKSLFCAFALFVTLSFAFSQETDTTVHTETTVSALDLISSENNAELSSGQPADLTEPAGTALSQNQTSDVKNALPEENTVNSSSEKTEAAVSADNKASPASSVSSASDISEEEDEDTPVHNVTITAAESIEYIEDLKAKILTARDAVNSEQEKKLTKTLNKAYSQLESKTFAALSVTDELSFQVYPFDAKEETWKIVITSELFDQTNLFTQIVELPWEAMSGSKLSKVEKMSSKEYASYASQVIMYDDMLISEKPNIALKLTYLIRPWNNASEYRFIPQELEVIRTDFNNQVIFSLEDADFNSESFTVNPSLEVRTFSEISKDMAKNEKYLQKETAKYNKKHPSVGTVKLPEQSYKKLEKKSAKEREPVIQHGRGSATINFCDHETNEDLADFNVQKIWLDNINGTVTLGLGHFGFFLFDVGGQVVDSTSNQYSINFGAGFGLSMNLFNFLRPYCYVAEDYITTKDLVTRLNAGIDFVFGNIFVITASYGYNFDIPIGSYDTSKSFIGNIGQYHSFSVGTGFSW